LTLSRHCSICLAADIAATKSERELDDLVGDAHLPQGDRGGEHEDADPSRGGENTSSFIKRICAALKRRTTDESCLVQTTKRSI
jgi:hypothetical protein